MDATATHGNSWGVLLVGMLGSIGSFIFGQVTAQEVVHIWHFIPGLFSVAFITYRWYMDVKDRKAKKKEQKDGTNDS